jgi:hypothetical protein
LRHQTSIRSRGSDTCLCVHTGTWTYRTSWTNNGADSLCEGNTPASEEEECKWQVGVERVCGWRYVVGEEWSGGVEGVERKQKYYPICIVYTISELALPFVMYWYYFGHSYSVGSGLCYFRCPMSAEGTLMWGWRDVGCDAVTVFGRGSGAGKWERSLIFALENYIHRHSEGNSWMERRSRKQLTTSRRLI